MMFSILLYEVDNEIFGKEKSNALLHFGFDSEPFSDKTILASQSGTLGHVRKIPC